MTADVPRSLAHVYEKSGVTYEIISSEQLVSENLKPDPSTCSHLQCGAQCSAQPVAFMHGVRDTVAAGATYGTAAIWNCADRDVCVLKSDKCVKKVGPSEC